MQNKTFSITVASLIVSAGVVCTGIVTAHSKPVVSVPTEAKKGITYEVVTNEDKMYSTSPLVLVTPLSATGIMETPTESKNGFRGHQNTTFSRNYSTVSVEKDVELQFTAIKEETYTRMITPTGKLLSATDGNLTLSDTINDSTKFNVSFTDSGNISLTSLEGSTIRFDILAQSFKSQRSSKGTLFSVLPRIYSKPKNNASAFSATMISSVGCDRSGINPPTMNKSWEEISASYHLLPTSDKRLLQQATYVVSGVGSNTVVTATGDTTAEIAEAMYLYDYIVAKYNWDNFIGRNISLSSLKLSPVNTLALSNSDWVSALTVCALVAVGALITFLVIKTSKLDNKK